jgi:hypothetical protein
MIISSETTSIGYVVVLWSVMIRSDILCLAFEFLNKLAFYISLLSILFMLDSEKEIQLIKSILYLLTDEPKLNK